MAQTLVQYGESIRDAQSRLYHAKACGRQRDDRLWEGWVEFEREDTGDVLRSTRETTQPNLEDLEYWATGLTTVYLEGALARVLTVLAARPSEIDVSPAFDGPAERPAGTIYRP